MPDQCPICNAQLPAYEWAASDNPSECRLTMGGWKRVGEIMKSEVRTSADFTQHKGGVYFEAGFALGLGIPVIWICRETDIEQTHFDTRQYNHIVWKDAQDLKEKLVARIEATVPLKNEH